MPPSKRTRATITSSGLQTIMDFALGDPSRPRREVALKLQDQFRAMQQPVPKLEVLERKVSYFRNRIGHDPIDEPWGVWTLTEHPISAEALPTVLEAWAHARADLGEKFTIREALWVARLYALFQGREISEVMLEAMAFAKREMQKGVIKEAWWQQGEGASETLRLYQDSRTLETRVTEERAREIREKPFKAEHRRRVNPEAGETTTPPRRSQHEEAI